MVEPDLRIVFNAPFSVRSVYNVRLLNCGAYRIGYAIKTTLPARRLEMNPTTGVLDSYEEKVVTLALGAFYYRRRRVYNDYISFEWANAPVGAGRQYRCDWFRGDTIVRRKHLPIEYNYTAL